MRCLVKNCKNECTLPRDFCNPCHDYITKKEGTSSQAYRNAILEGVCYVSAHLIETLVKELILKHE